LGKMTYISGKIFNGIWDLGKEKKSVEWFDRKFYLPFNLISSPIKKFSIIAKIKFINYI
jgi:hypothetical protein